MLIKLFAGLSALAAAITTLTAYVTQPFYSQICMVLLLFIAYFVGILLAYVILLFLITELTVSLKRPQDKPSKFWVKQLNLLAEAICILCNVRVHVKGLEKIPTDKRFLMVCNHKSLFDPIVKIPVLKDYDIIYASKAENFRIPICGKIMHKTGCLAMDRDNNREALKTIKRMVEYIESDEASVCIYPEGTRNRKEGLLPFHPGSFKPAQKTSSPVVVISLRGTDVIKKKAPFKKTDVYIEILKVIDGEFAGSNSTQITAHIAQAAIEEKLNESKNTEIKELSATK